MALDPRLGAASLGIADPTEARFAAVTARISGLESQLRALQTTATVQASSGAPTSAARDGTLYVDITATRLYVRANGVWRYAALT